MTANKIDPETGLPELPEGQYWHVGKSGIAVNGAPSIRVEARKTLKLERHMERTSRTEYPSVLEALRDESEYRRGFYQITWPGGGLLAAPDLWSDDVELVNEKIEKAEYFTPKRLFRKPKLDYVEYHYEADVLWDEHEVLFSEVTYDFSEEGILQAAKFALDDYLKKTENDRFVSRVSGDYPPKKLEIK